MESLGFTSGSVLGCGRNRLVLEKHVRRRTAWRERCGMQRSWRKAIVMAKSSPEEDVVRCAVSVRPDVLLPRTALNVGFYSVRKKLTLGLISLFMIMLWNFKNLRPALALGGGITLAGRGAVSSNAIAVFFLLFTVAAALAAAETAITTLWPWKVREIAIEEGEGSMFAILEQDLTRFLTTILIATTVATIFTTALATELASAAFAGKAVVAYVTGGLTFFFLFFGEILPKSLAVHNAERVLRILLPFVHGLSLILYPVGKVLAFGAKMILRLLNMYNEGDAPVSEQELRMIIAGADRSGSIEPYESKLISNVLDLEEIDVRDVMCPRVDMVSLDVTSTLRDFLEVEAKFHFSRVPVYQDTIDNIVGVMYSKSLLRYLEMPEKLDTTQVQELLDVPYFVPESLSAWNVLEQMRLRRLHMAIVVDEYGGTAGLVTLEDILEEVVGEIYDEDDAYEATSPVVVKRADGSYRIGGQAELYKVSEELNLKMSDDDLDQHGTISGFLCDRMEGIPSSGDTVTIDNVTFEIVEADDRRITTLLASPVAQSTEVVEDQNVSASVSKSSE